MSEATKTNRYSSEPVPTEAGIRTTLTTLISTAERVPAKVSEVLEHAATLPESERVACLCRVHDQLYRAFWPLTEAGSALQNELEWWEVAPGDELKGNAPNESLPTAEDPVPRHRVATPAEVIAATSELRQRVQDMEKGMEEIVASLGPEAEPKVGHWLRSVLWGLDQASYDIRWAEMSFDDAARTAAGEDGEADNEVMA